MRHVGRPLRQLPKSDLQSRLRFIEGECEKLTGRMQGGNVQPSGQDVAELAHAVGYLARIVEKHLADNER